jgi:hypothetical protein
MPQSKYNAILPVLLRLACDGNRFHLISFPSSLYFPSDVLCSPYSREGAMAMFCYLPSTMQSRYLNNLPEILPTILKVFSSFTCLTVIHSGYLGLGRRCRGRERPSDGSRAGDHHTVRARYVAQCARFYRNAFFAINLFLFYRIEGFECAVTGVGERSFQRKLAHSTGFHPFEFPSSLNALMVIRLLSPCWEIYWSKLLQKFVMLELKEVACHKYGMIS